MAIAFNKYINITSGIGAGITVPTRELIGRIFTTNVLLPPNSFIEFTTLADVGTYFGTVSEEYARANAYFSFIGKSITSPQKLSFARWVPAPVAPLIFGGAITLTLSQFHAITTGSFTLTMGDFTFHIGSLDFSGAANLAAVATILQTAIQAETGGGALWTAATVTYDALTGGFNLTGGATGIAPISVAAGTTGVDISVDMGWLPESINGGVGAIWSPGETTETITATLTNSAGASNNFGSFLFTDTAALDLTQYVEAATWNAAQNLLFQLYVPVSAANASSWAAALANFAGVGVTYAPLATEYPEQLPMQILASTNYDNRNSTQNYMFQQANLTPSVTDTLTSNAYDTLRINYYGQTQQAGQLLAFYQRGLLMGLAVNPADMNTYANEQWFKDAAGAALMQLLLALTKVSANNQGRAQILSTLQPIIQQALDNGTISVGKTLTTTQKLYINELSDTTTAWVQVQNIGYWLNCYINSFVADGGNTEFQANYLLIYSKDDVIRKINGTHALI